MCRAQSLFLALGALVRPSVNSFYTVQVTKCKFLGVAIWAYSASIEHNENKYKNQNISHKS